MFHFQLGELFCGPGGIGKGADLAEVPGVRFSHVWATDIDRDSCRTYQHNIPEAKVIRADIDEIQKTNFARLEKAGAINALSFGFPCNDFSVVGKQAGVAGVFGGLYRHCVAAVAHFAPVWFLAENVAGLKSADDGNTMANRKEKSMSNEVWCSLCNKEIIDSNDPKWAVCEACGLNWCGECRKREGWDDVEEQCSHCPDNFILS